MQVLVSSCKVYYFSGLKVNEKDLKTVSFYKDKLKGLGLVLKVFGAKRFFLTGAFNGLSALPFLFNIDEEDEFEPTEDQILI